MREWVYRNKYNSNKYLGVKRYKDGHYVWQQWIQHIGSEPIYVGCSLKQNKRGGVLHRISKRTMVEVLADYELVVAV